MTVAASQKFRRPAAFTQLLNRSSNKRVLRGESSFKDIDFEEEVVPASLNLTLRGVLRREMSTTFESHEAAWRPWQCGEPLFLQSLGEPEGLHLLAFEEY